MTRARQPRRRPAAIIVRMFLHRRLAWLGPALLAAACTPALNWRQVSLPPTTAVGLLPCKPDRL